MASLRKLSLNILFFLVTLFSFGQETNKDKSYFIAEAFSYPQTSDEFRICIDSALILWPNDAQLWREKATSHFKAGQYAPAMKYINKAVELDTMAWLGYRGFMKCVFMKDYESALVDLKEMYQKRPLEQIMDHSYPFWIGISHLKLNQLDSANHYLALCINQSQTKGSEWVHYNEWFYGGMGQFRQKNYEKAMTYFNNATTSNPHFPDAEFYKALILMAKNDNAAAKQLLLKAKADLLAGYRMNEDNETYVNYPFQITLTEIEKYLQML